jgi:hypothetical protein
MYPFRVLQRLHVREVIVRAPSSARVLDRSLVAFHAWSAYTPSVGQQRAGAWFGHSAWQGS